MNQSICQWNTHRTDNLTGFSHILFSSCVMTVIGCAPSAFMISVGAINIIRVALNSVQINGHQIRWLYCFRLILAMIIVICSTLCITLMTTELHSLGEYIVHFFIAIGFIFFAFMIVFLHYKRLSASQSHVLTLFVVLFTICWIQVTVKCIRRAIRSGDAYDITVAALCVIEEMDGIMLLFFFHKSDVTPSEKIGSPKENASVLSDFCLSWLSNVIWSSRTKTLENEDISEIESVLHVRNTFESYRNAMHPDELSHQTYFKPHVFTGKEDARSTEEMQDAIPANTRSLKSFIVGYSACGMVPAVIFASLSALGQIWKAVSVSITLQYVKDARTREWTDGFTLVVSLGFVEVATNVLQANALYLSARMAVGIRSALSMAIYDKALRLSTGSRSECGVGRLMVLFVTDTNNVAESLASIQQICYIIVTVISCVLIFITTVNNGAIVVAALGVVSSIVTALLLFIISRLQTRQLRAKDERLNLVTNTLKGIKLIKMYCWESVFMAKIRAKWNDEFRWFLWSQISFIGLRALHKSLPQLLVALLIYVSFSFGDDKNRNLTGNSMFMILIAGNLCTIQLMAMFVYYCKLLYGISSYCRIRDFLETEETDLDAIGDVEEKLYHLDDEKITPIACLQRASFSWTKNGSSFLKQLDLTVTRGELIVVVGAVGSGKSALLSAFLAELYLTGGAVRVAADAAVAYAPQQPVVLNRSFRDNITFGRHFEETLFWRVLAACDLLTDVDIMPYGVSTDIGEGGATISGGQAVRVSLSRTVYQKADFYLLDEPLAAVDSVVADHIFAHVISNRGILHHTTRLVATHHMQHIEEADRIIVMDGGRIVQLGQFEELMADSEGQFHRMYDSANSRNNGNALKSTETDLEEKIRVYASRISDQCYDRVMVDEEKEIGSVSYKTYWKQVSATWVVLIPVVVALAASRLFTILATKDVEKMSQVRGNLTNYKYSERTTSYCTAYLLFSMAATLALVICVLLFISASKIVADLCHNRFVERLCYAPMTFFDTTPIGRLINRLSRDLDDLLVLMTANVPQLFGHIASVVSMAIAACATFPYLWIIVIPAGAVIFVIQCFYVQYSLKTRRLDAVSRSPLLSHAGETFAAIAVIRCARAESRYMAEAMTAIGTNCKHYFHNTVARSWFITRAGVCKAAVCAGVAAYVVLRATEMSHATAGFVLTVTFLGIESVSMVAECYCDVETTMVAAERLENYCSEEFVPSEGALRAIGFGDDQPNWPPHGRVELINVTARYTLKKEPALHHMSVDMGRGPPPPPELLRDGSALLLVSASAAVSGDSGGVRIGVVGRTGAGKSSLAALLLRLIHLDDGVVRIDGVNIGHIGLHDLREKVSILPQKPYIFNGSVKFNLDPADQCTDAEVWRALELCHVATLIRALPGQLEYRLSSNDDAAGFSTGQRQLLCLARVFLRRSRLVILDEATASVDLETDLLIQEVVHTELHDATVIIIAHRIQTVLNCDRILVLEAGRAVEFDSPDALLSDMNSQFYSLAKMAQLV